MKSFIPQPFSPPAAFAAMGRLGQPPEEHRKEPDHARCPAYVTTATGRHLLYVTRPLLYHAARDGRSKDVRDLLRSGAAVSEVNIRDESGNTPLGVAARNGHLPIVTTLLAAGANPNLQNRVGASPILAAAKHGHLDVAAALLAAAASPNICNLDGQSPLIAAATYGHGPMAHLLCTHGADKNYRTPSSRAGISLTAAEAASRRGHTQLSAWLSQQT
jgi:ankyrin repeat protein